MRINKLLAICKCTRKQHYNTSLYIWCREPLLSSYLKYSRQGRNDASQALNTKKETDNTHNNSPNTDPLTPFWKFGASSLLRCSHISLVLLWWFHFYKECILFGLYWKNSSTQDDRVWALLVIFSKAGNRSHHNRGQMQTLCHCIPGKSTYPRNICGTIERKKPQD